MINPEVERRYADCKELVEAWRQFLELFNNALKPQFSVSPAAEQGFLESKARIAMLHDSFMDSLKHDQVVGQNMMNIVTRAITLRIVSRMQPTEAKKIEIEWHEAYLLLNETVAQLEEDRARLANVNEMTWKMGRLAERAKVLILNFIGSMYFKISVVVLVILFVFWIGPALGLYDFNMLRSVQAGGVGKYYTQFIDARRKLGIAGPYGSMEKFTEERLTPIATKGWQTEVVATILQEQVAAAFARLQVTGAGSGKDAIAAATGFDCRWVENASVTKTYIYSFYFFEPVPARNFAASFAAGAPADMSAGFTAFADENVLVILATSQSGLPNAEGQRQQVKTMLFP